MTSPSGTRTIQVGALARVEGEGGLFVKVRDGQVTDVQLRIFEPPRFFEALLRGREFVEAPDITARICGICPVAYQMSAVGALERALGIEVDGGLRDLRKLLYHGEWIESHALHVFLLHLPDFLGCRDVLEVAREHKPLVEGALRLKKIGNLLLARIGGREIHPINVRVGGFYKLPARADLLDLREQLLWARDFVREALVTVAGLEFPEFERPYQYVALRHPSEYPLMGGRLVSNAGLNIGVERFEQEFVERQSPHSNALHAFRVDGSRYFVGPLARYNLCGDRLSPLARDSARGAGLGPVCNNPFRSILVRLVEVLHAVDQSIQLIDEYRAPDAPCVSYQVHAGTGWAITEAPRGILYHRYRIDPRGMVQEARIVPPTSQNQGTIEEDLRAFIPPRLHLPQAQLVWQCEQAIRNYDPCISCATHFLTLDLDHA